MLSAGHQLILPKVADQLFTCGNSALLSLTKYKGGFSEPVLFDQLSQAVIQILLKLKSVSIVLIAQHMGFQLNGSVFRTEYFEPRRFYVQPFPDVLDVWQSRTDRQYSHLELILQA